MKGKNYYETLEVSPNASQDVIRMAYKSLVKQYHPDNGGADEERIKEINEAFQILNDPEKRRQYDEELQYTGQTHYERKTRSYEDEDDDGIDIDEVRSVLAKVSRMYPDIVDNSDIYYSSRLDIRKTTFFEDAESVLDVPEDAYIFILYVHKPSSDSWQPDKSLAITDRGIYLYDEDAFERKVSWRSFRARPVEKSSRGVQIGSSFFSSTADDDLLAIFKEIHDMLIVGYREESLDEENEQIIKKKLTHNIGTVIGAVAAIVFFRYKGWTNLFIKIVDFCIVFYLCDFFAGFCKLTKWEEMTQKVCKWLLYGLGALVWYVLLFR